VLSKSTYSIENNAAENQRIRISKIFSVFLKLYGILNKNKGNCDYLRYAVHLMEKTSSYFNINIDQTIISECSEICA